MNKFFNPIQSKFTWGLFNQFRLVFITCSRAINFTNWVEDKILLVLQCFLLEGNNNTIDPFKGIKIRSQVGHRRQVVNPKYANFGSREYTRSSDSVRRVCDLNPRPFAKLEEPRFQSREREREREREKDFQFSTDECQTRYG